MDKENKVLIILICAIVGWFVLDSLIRASIFYNTFSSPKIDTNLMLVGLGFIIGMSYWQLGKIFYD